MRVLGQAIREHRAGGPAPDDDVVELRHRSDAIRSRRPRSAAPSVLAGDPALRQGSREPFWVLDGDVQRRRPEDAQAGHTLTEVDPDATRLHAVEGEDAVPDPAPDADRGDPEPRALDTPGTDVAHGRSKTAIPEPRVQLIAEIDIRVVRLHAEQDPKQTTRTAAELDGKALPPG